jgi:hypothetical protein
VRLSLYAHRKIIQLPKFLSTLSNPLKKTSYEMKLNEKLMSSHAMLPMLLLKLYRSPFSRCGRSNLNLL